MPGREEELKVRITGEDQLSPVLDRVQRRAESMSARLKKAGQAAARGMMIIGGAASAMAGLSIKAATDFEASMSRALMMFGDISQEQRDNLSQLARTIAVETGTSSRQAAEALWFLGSAGMEASEAGKALGDIMKVVAARGIDAASMGELAMTSMQLFGYEAKDTAKVLNILAGAEASSLINLEDLREAFVYAAPTAAQLGMSLEETAATIAALGRAGVRGSIAGTALARVMEGMLDPTDEARAMLQRLGISIWDQQGRMRSVVEVIKDIEKATRGMTQQQKTMISTTLFGTRELRAFNAITQVSTDFINELTDQLKTSNDVQRQWEDWTQTNAYRLGQLKAKLEDTAISVGEKLVPVLTPLIESFGRILEKLTPLIEKHGALIAKVLLATAVLLPLGLALQVAISAVGGLVTIMSVLPAVFTALTGPAGIAVAAIAALVTVGILVWKNWDTIKETLSSIWNAISSGARAAFEGLKAALAAIFKGVLTYMLAPFRGILELIDKVIGAVRRIPIIGSRIPGLGAMADLVRTAKEAIGRVTYFEHGGLIPEPTLLYGLKSKRPYAIAGERGPEWVGPPGSVNNHFHIRQVTVRSEDDIQKIARALYELQERRARAVGVR
jgi:TP901 family phage tail tape measure protein